MQGVHCLPSQPPLSSHRANSSIAILVVISTVPSSTPCSCKNLVLSHKTAFQLVVLGYRNISQSSLFQVNHIHLALGEKTEKSNTILNSNTILHENVNRQEVPYKTATL